MFDWYLNVNIFYLKLPTLREVLKRGSDWYSNVNFGFYSKRCYWKQVSICIFINEKTIWTLNCSLLSYRWHHHHHQAWKQWNLDKGIRAYFYLSITHFFCYTNFLNSPSHHVSLSTYLCLFPFFLLSFFLSFFLSRSLHLLDSQENSFPFRGKTSSELKHVLISYSLSSPLSLISSVTRPSQIGKFFKALGNLTRVYLMFGQILNLLWEFFVPLCILSL